jgi:hypothetical protein
MLSDLIHQPLSIGLLLQQDFGTAAAGNFLLAVPANRQHCRDTRANKQER